MSANEPLESLKDNLQRWRLMLPEAEGTYCQGIANKAFGQLELVLKDLLSQRLAASGADLSDLLISVRYTGSARTVHKLPPGTLVHALLKLAEQDDPLGSAITGELRTLLSQVVPARNLTTHEVLSSELRERTRRLLEMIDQIARSSELASLLKSVA